MSVLKIIRPEPTTNLCPNPSAERDLTGYAAFGAAPAPTRSTLWQARGAYSVRSTPSGAGQGVTLPQFTAAGGVAYTVSAWVRVVSGTWRLFAAAGVEQGGLGPGTEQRVSVTWTPTAGVRTPRFEQTSSGAGEAYIDAVQYEALSYPTSYVDGDEPGGRWTGREHASTSLRPVGVRTGGREIDIADDPGYDVQFSTVAGVGMPPVRHITAPLATRDGAVLQQIRADPTLIAITARIGAVGSAAFHALHRAFVDLVKPGALATLQPFRLIYSGAARELEVDCHYLTGLEGQLAPPSDAEEFTVQFVAYDPRWNARRDKAAALTLNSTIANANYIVGRRGGVWQALGSGANNHVRRTAIGPDGSLYIVGDFTSVGGLAANYIARWDPNTGVWSALGSGLNDIALDLAFDAAGNLYVTGRFTTAGGVAANRVARWNGTSWSALGSGLGGTVGAGVAHGQTIGVAPDGKVWVGGFFTTAGGAQARGIATWDPATSTWSCPGDVNLSNGTYGVIVLTIDEGGVVFVAGTFFIAGGAAFEDTARWDPRTSSWSAVSADPNAGVFALTIGPDGLLYLGGAFTNTAFPYVARWVPTTTALEGLGGGANNLVRTLAFDEHGTLWAVGLFSEIGGVKAVDRIARWNGSAWLPADIRLPAGNTVRGLVIDRRTGDLYVGGEFSGTATGAGVTTLVNEGSAHAFPVFRFRGAGRLLSIRNITTGREIALDLTLVAGEELTIDLRPGRKTVRSSLWGNRLARVLPGSALGDFALTPGSNQIAILMTGTDGATEAQAIWREQHWGAE